MKSPLFIFAILFPLVSAAQTNGVRHHRDIMNPKKKIDRSGEIQGKCIVQAGGGNLMATPCTEVILILNGTGKDAEPISTRTDRAGNFLFSTALGQSYKIAAGSKFYEVVEPAHPVRSGDIVQLILKQK